MCWKPSALWTGVLLALCSAALEVHCRPSQQPLHNISHPSSSTSSVHLEFPLSLQRHSLVSSYLDNAKKAKNDETRPTSFTVKTFITETSTMSTLSIPMVTKTNTASKKPPEARSLEAETSTLVQDIQFIESEHEEFRANHQMDSEAPAERKTVPLSNSESEVDAPQNVTDSESEQKPKYNSKHVHKPASEPETIPFIEHKTETYLEKKTNPTLASELNTNILMSSGASTLLPFTDMKSKKEDLSATETKPNPGYIIPAANTKPHVMGEPPSTNAVLQPEDKLSMEDDNPQSIVELFVTSNPPQIEDKKPLSMGGSITSSPNSTSDKISDFYMESEHEPAVEFYDNAFGVEAAKDSEIKDNKNTDAEIDKGSMSEDFLSFMAEADKSYMLKNNKTPLFRTEKYSLAETDEDFLIEPNEKSTKDEGEHSNSEFDKATMTVDDTDSSNEGDNNSHADSGKTVFMDSDKGFRGETNGSSLIIPIQDSLTETNEDINVVVNKDLTTQTKKEHTKKIKNDFIRHIDKNAAESLETSTNVGNNFSINNEVGGSANSQNVTLTKSLFKETNGKVSKDNDDHKKEMIKSDPALLNHDALLKNTNNTTENEGIPTMIVHENIIEESVSDSFFRQRDSEDEESTPEPKFKDELITLHSQHEYTTPAMTWLRIRMSVDPPCDCNETPKTVIEAPEDLDIVLDPWRNQRTWDLTGDFKTWKKKEDDCDESGSGSDYQDGSGAIDQYHGSRSVSQEGLGLDNHEGSGIGSQKEKDYEAESIDEAMEADEKTEASQYMNVTTVEEGNDANENEITYKESNAHLTANNVRNVVTILSNKVKAMEETVKDLVEKGEDTVMTHTIEMGETIGEMAKKGRETVEENVEKLIEWEKGLIAKRKKE